MKTQRVEVWLTEYTNNQSSLKLREAMLSTCELSNWAVLASNDRHFPLKLGFFLLVRQKVRGAHKSGGLLPFTHVEVKLEPLGEDREGFRVESNLLGIQVTFC